MWAWRGSASPSRPPRGWSSQPLPSLPIRPPAVTPVCDIAAVGKDPIDTVERVAKAEFWSIAQRDAHFVETPFTVADATLLTNGVIDLLFVSADSDWQVVDYKTDRKLDDRRYAQQLAAYRSALRELGCSVSSATIVNVRESVL